MSIKLLIFDLDGTLVDTAADITEALNHAVAPHVQTTFSEARTASLIGDGITSLIEKAMHGTNGMARDDARKRFLDYYSRNIANHSRPYPNVAKTLKKLSVFKKAVVTNKREALSVKLLESLDLASRFWMVIGGDSTSEKKPSAVPIRRALELAGVTPREALVVGDSPVDIRAASNAGVRSVAVTYGYNEPTTLAGADHTINDMGDLIKLLLKIKAIEEKRREERHPIPPVYQKYIKLKMQSGQEYLQATLLDFSEHGIMLKSIVPFSPGQVVECVATVPKSLTRMVLFKAVIRHCEPSDEDFIIGAEIQSVSDETWFRVFKKILAFIKERENAVF